MIGEPFGKWVLQRDIGRGAMGEVFLARDTNGRTAAVKVLAPELTGSTTAVTRFRREIEALGRLDHPNIVRLYESGEQGHRLYFAMEFVDGPSLDQRIDRGGRLPWPEALDLATQVASALKHAHDHGVIHRDLKPSNLLLGKDGVLKLTDFGIAHLFASEHLTRTGQVIGTAEYLSPEQASGKPATRRSDLYSLGAVLYTLLTGRPPFAGTTAVDLLHKHLYARFDPPRAVVPQVPEELDSLVCRLLAKSPSERPADAGALLRELQALRMRLARRQDVTYLGVPHDSTMAGAPTREAPGVEQGTGSRISREGEATLVSRVVRDHLEAQNAGGPLKRFLNRPVVLASLLAVCVGVLAYTFWPVGPDYLFRQGQALMARDNPEDWQVAWDRYLEPLQQRFPDHPYREQVQAFRKQIDDHRATRRAASLPRDAGAAPALPGEAEWFYRKGQRLRQRGDLPAARAVWRDLIQAFADIPGEDRWVRLAQQELDRTDESGGAVPSSGPGAALERARQLKQDGRPGAAEAAMQALQRLYADDTAARGSLKSQSP